MAAGQEGDTGNSEDRGVKGGREGKVLEKTLNMFKIYRVMFWLD